MSRSATPLHWTIAVTVTLACVAASAAVAQFKPEVRTGSLIPVKPKEVKGQDAGRIRKAFAQCMYRNAPAAAATLLAHSDPLASDFAAAKLDDFATRFDMETCLGEQSGADESTLGFKFARVQLHIMLAEEAYLAGYRAAPSLPDGAVEPLDRAFISGGDGLAQARAIATFADCVTFHDVAHADALLRTMPDSPEERSAARALAPALGGCLYEGDKLSLSPASIRSYVADGMWNRFSRAQAAPRAAVAAKPAVQP